MSLPEQTEIKRMNRKDTRDMEIVHHPQHLKTLQLINLCLKRNFFLANTQNK